MKKILILSLIIISSFLSACNTDGNNSDGKCEIDQTLVVDECIDNEDLNCEIGNRYDLDQKKCVEYDNLDQCAAQHYIVDGECVKALVQTDCRTGYVLINNSCMEPYSFEPVVCDVGFIIYENFCIPDFGEETCEVNEVLIDGNCQLNLPNETRVDYKQIVYHGVLFDVLNSNIETSYFENVYDITYVNVTDFLDIIGNAFVDFTVEQTSVLTIDFNDNSIVIDPGTDSITLSNYKVFDNMNYYPGESLYSNIVVESTESLTLTAITYDLDNYGVDIVLKDNEIYVPVYIANIFLTGSGLNLVETDHEILVFDYYYDSDSLDSLYTDYSNNQNVEKVAYETDQYLQIFFDHFYGVKLEETNVSYSDIIHSYEIKLSNSFEELNQKVDKLMIDLDDAHTRLLSGGIYESDFENSSTFYEGSRLNTLNEELEFRACDERYEEFRVYKEGDKTFVEINAFTYNTKNYTDVFANNDIADNYIIDLSCNTGGLLLGLLEVITFLSDQDISISYYYPNIDEQITENYSSSFEQDQKDTFTIIISEVTFSAGNLFASIVKDYDLGEVIGTKSSGGASAIQYNVLPNGSLFVSSSNIVLLDIDGNSIEYGIDPDRVLDISFEDGVLDEDLLVFIEDGSFQIQSEQKGSTVEITFNVTESFTEVTDLSYLVTVYSMTKLNSVESLIETEKFTGSSFTYNYNFPINDRLIRVKVTAKYKVDGMNHSSLIYDNFYDKYPDTFNDYTQHLSDTYKLNVISNHDYDYDAFKVIAEASGLYEIKNDYNLEYQFDLFDEDGNYLESGYEFYLDEGIYFVRPNQPIINAIPLFAVYKGTDIIEDIVIDVFEGVTNYPVVMDYPSDVDFYSLTVVDEVLLSISSDLSSGQEISIGNVEEQWPFSVQYGVQTREFLLTPGTYQIKIESSEKIQGNLRLEFLLNEDDYDSEYYGENGNYGVLVPGENKINVNASNDSDIYKLVLNEGDEYLFYSSNGLSIDVIEGTIFSYFRSPAYFSTPGTYYFKVSSYGLPIDERFITIVDLNNEMDEGLKEMKLNSYNYSVFHNEFDVDTYQLVVDESGRFITNITSGYIYEVFDLSGTLVVSEQSGYIDLEQGQYNIEVSCIDVCLESIVGVVFEEVVDVSSEIHDSDLPIESYTELLEGYENRLSHIFDGDSSDFYKIVITEKSVVNLYPLSSDIDILINGSSSSENSIVLDPGTYLIKVSNYMGDSYAYEVWFETRPYISE